MKEKDFIKSQKDCAKLLGMTLKEYNESLKNIKGNFEFENNQNEDNDNILEQLGLTNEDLKKRMC